MQSGRLVRVLSDYETTPGTFDHNFYIVYDRSRYVSPKIRAFVDFCADHFRTIQRGRSAEAMP